jgi:hypothetical protein
MVKENKKLLRIKAGEARRAQEREQAEQAVQAVEEDEKEVEHVNKNNDDDKYREKLRTIASSIANPGRQIGRKTKGVNEKRDNMVAQFMNRKKDDSIVALGIVQKLNPILIKKMLDGSGFDNNDYRIFAKLLLDNENTKKSVVFMTQQHKENLVYFIENNHAQCPEFIIDIKNILPRIERDIITQTPARK